jgi:hypothetical protein
MSIVCLRTVCVHVCVGGGIVCVCVCVCVWVCARATNTHPHIHIHTTDTCPHAYIFILLLTCTHARMHIDTMSHLYPVRRKCSSDIDGQCGRNHCECITFLMRINLRSTETQSRAGMQGAVYMKMYINMYITPAHFGCARARSLAMAGEAPAARRTFAEKSMAT